MTHPDIPTVLVVDDEQQLVELYSLFLAADYEVMRAVGGEEALSKIDAAVDVVLLDRRMPDVSGDKGARCDSRAGDRVSGGAVDGRRTSQ